MKALSLLTPLQFEYQEIAEDFNLEASEALVKIHKIGICGTDYHAYAGKQPFFSYPRILGHELGVEVVAVGTAVTRVKVGDKCAVEPYLNCGECWACKRGLSNCCENIKVMGVHTDGGMTELVKLPAEKLHVSDVLDYEALALVETLGIGAHAVARAAVQAHDTVLVIGAGPIGLAVMEFAKIRGAKVAVLDLNPNRLNFCVTNQKADVAIVADDNALDHIKVAFDGNLPTVVFDATGNKYSMHKAFSYPASGGKLVFVGLYQGEYTFQDPDFHRRELTLFASRNSMPSDFTYIIKAIEEGKIDVQTWITHRITFEEIAEKLPLLVQDASLVKAIISV